MATKKTVEKVDIEQKDIDEIKLEITNYAEKRIEIEVEEAVKRAEKRLINQKNYAIIKRNILIIFLLILSAYLTYLLYNTGYFNKYINKNEMDRVEEKKLQDSEEVKPDEKDESALKQEKMIEKYSHLLNNLELSENSKYINDYYNGDLTTELKLYLSANMLDENDIICEDNTYIIENEKLEENYKKIFTDNDYQKSSFEYNNLKYKYLKTQDIFIAEGTLNKEKTNIVKVISLIEEKQNKVEITTIEALVEKNKIYNIKTEEEIAQYKDDSSLEENKKKLNNMKYIFICGEENCYLNNIEPIK